MKAGQFLAECLTISLGTDCILNCIYCFSDNKTTQNSLQLPLFLNSVQQASQFILKNNTLRNNTFFLGFQGSGEPLMYFEKLVKSFNLVSTIVQSHHKTLQTFITSNGCMEPEKYKWMAQYFNRICISVDGEKQIHNMQRQTKNGSGTFDRVSNTIHLLNTLNKTPSIRITITKQNVSELAETVHILNKTFNITDISVEPVFLTDSKENLSPEPEEFVNNYLIAKNYAYKKGIQLCYSGYRPDENHGPYCMINKNVLFLTASGVITNCLFKDNEEKNGPFSIGYFNEQTQELKIFQGRINIIKQKQNKFYKDCLACPLVNSCVKGCPDYCYLSGSKKTDVKQSLRCKINTLLYNRMLHEK